MALWRRRAITPGAKLGLCAHVQPHPISVLWPPNSILLAALLLAPVALVVAHPGRGFPAHLLAELQGGVPLAMVLCWYVSNVSEALIGAACVRAAPQGAVRPSTACATSAFFCSFAVFLGPFLSSFLDARS